MRSIKRLTGLIALFTMLLGFNESIAQPVCQAGFGYQQAALGGPFTVTFFDSTSAAPGCQVTTHQWNYGDGTMGTGPLSTHAYNAPGTYTVCLTVTTSCGCVDTFCLPVTVTQGGGASCNANFNASSQGLRVNFSSAQNPPGTAYSWDFGDGTTANGPSPFHQYQTTGTYTVCLIVSNVNANCADTFCSPVTVSPPPPCQATFQAWPNPMGGISFNGAATGGVPPYSYSWDFGDNTFGFGQQTMHTYNGSGPYVACLTVISADSCVSIFCDTVFGNPGGPGNGCRAAFQPQVQGSTVSFINLSSGSGALTFTWLFGDSSSSNALSPTHTYSGPGPYVACLIIADTSGCSDTACMTILPNGGGGPNPGPCSVAFQSFDSAGTAGFFAMPNGPVFGNPATYYWSFGDGTNDTTTSPFTSHQYNANGMYYACLTMVTWDSCVATFCDSVLIGPPANPTCNASFWTSHFRNAGGQGGPGIYFNNMSTSNDIIAGWHWDFGDGDTSVLRSPHHTYANPGTYHVCLTMTTVNGCTDTWCDSVTIHPPSVNLWANHHHFTTVTPGFPLWVHIQYGNMGSLASNPATVSYRYPAGVNFASAYPVPSTVDTANRMLTWSVGVVNPQMMGSGFIRVDFDVDTFLALGTAAHDTVWIRPYAGDIDSTNNWNAIVDTVVGSWDPNDKSASPAGEGENGNIDPNTSELNYLIRFQNTGTAPAVNVVIRDTLDANLDPSSIQMQDASHSYTMDIEQGNILVWRFANIYLPDSNSNEPESHGYVNFRIALDENLPVGTRIENTAAIYFDFNAPVITNTQVNTLFEKTVGIKDIYTELDLAVMPNPSQGQVVLSAVENIRSVKVYDLMGQEVYRNSDLDERLVNLNLGNLATGTYLIRVESEGSFTTKKLVIQN